MRWRRRGPLPPYEMTTEQAEKLGTMTRVLSKMHVDPGLMRWSLPDSVEDGLVYWWVNDGSFSMDGTIDRAGLSTFRAWRVEPLFEDLLRRM